MARSGVGPAQEPGNARQDHRRRDAGHLGRRRQRCCSACASAARSTRRKKAGPSSSPPAEGTADFDLASARRRISPSLEVVPGARPGPAGSRCSDRSLQTSTCAAGNVRNRGSRTPPAAASCRRRATRRPRQRPRPTAPARPAAPAGLVRRHSSCRTTPQGAGNDLGHGAYRVGPVDAAGRTPITAFGMQVGTANMWRPIAGFWLAAGSCLVRPVGLGLDLPDMPWRLHGLHAARRRSALPAAGPAVGPWRRPGRLGPPAAGAGLHRRDRCGWRRIDRGRDLAGHRQRRSPASGFSRAGFMSASFC